GGQGSLRRRTEGSFRPEGCPAEEQRGDDEQDREALRCGVDRREERPVVHDPHPEPERRQDQQGAAARASGVADGEPERQKSEKIEENLRRPHSFVVAPEHLEELSDGEWKVHIEAYRATLCV